MNYSLNDKDLIVMIEKASYNETVVYKCFYWYTGHYNVRIDESDFQYYKIRLSGKIREIAIPESEELIRKIENDLVDFKLRDIVAKETGTIRELLVAKAFSHYEPEEKPSTLVSDPVGFDPDSVTVNERDEPNN